MTLSIPLFYFLHRDQLFDQAITMELSFTNNYVMICYVTPTISYFAFSSQ